MAEHAVSEYVDIAVAQSSAQDAAIIASSDSRDRLNFLMVSKMWESNTYEYTLVF